MREQASERERTQVGGRQREKETPSRSREPHPGLDPRTKAPTEPSRRPLLIILFSLADLAAGVPCTAQTACELFVWLLRLPSTATSSGYVLGSHRLQVDF